MASFVAFRLDFPNESFKILSYLDFKVWEAHLNLPIQKTHTALGGLCKHFAKVDSLTDTVRTRI